VSIESRDGLRKYVLLSFNVLTRYHWYKLPVFSVAPVTLSHKPSTRIIEEWSLLAHKNGNCSCTRLLPIRLACASSSPVSYLKARDRSSTPCYSLRVYNSSKDSGAQHSTSRGIHLSFHNYNLNTFRNTTKTKRLLIN
jgi:hypothetical protein